jgi:4-hydroxybenzoate polyprenyltransferase
LTTTSSAKNATHPGLSRLKLFMALSRTPHGLIDMATPGLAAMLWLGAMPSISVILLGILTAFAGYTAVYALNDVVDYRVDQEKIRETGLLHATDDLDAVYARHPLAQGLLTLKESILWTAGWGTVALVGAYALNPACAFVFIAACIAEAVYCLMLRVSYLRVLVSGGVKTAGAMAAVFAVASNPSPYFMICLFLWLFFWEIGG